MIDQYREGFHAGFLAARDEAAKLCAERAEMWDIQTALREAVVAEILHDLIKTLPLPSRNLQD